MMNTADYFNPLFAYACTRVHDMGGLVVLRTREGDKVIKPRDEEYEEDNYTFHLVLEERVTGLKEDGSLAFRIDDFRELFKIAFSEESAPYHALYMRLSEQVEIAGRPILV